MKHLLVFLLILIIFKGTESNHLNLKSWPISSYQNVYYDLFNIDLFEVKEKLFLNIAYLLKETDLIKNFRNKKLKEDSKVVEYICRGGIIATTFVSSYSSEFGEPSDIVIEKCLEHLMNCSPNNIHRLMDFKN